MAFSNDNEKNSIASGKLYDAVYKHYISLIVNGSLSAGTRMPSLRTVCRELNVSKTTAETAYLNLAADGYIYSRERSGYYVRDISPLLQNMGHAHSAGSPVNSAAKKLPVSEISRPRTTTAAFAESSNNSFYDLATVGDDRNSFCFSLWERYMKSALRHTERLVSYGTPQGESELRYELVGYVHDRRNIYCSPDNIVIAASAQSLLLILVPLLKKMGCNTASVPARGFERYAQAFLSHDISVGVRDKEADILFVSPSRMTEWGEVMPMSRRNQIIEHSRNGHFIIEDDYLSELNFSKQPAPSLYALSAGHNVVYIGSFSRVLLPSIRISYMILPDELMPAYREISKLYDQTASKTEQIALASFLRDGHLTRHIRKLHRLYAAKRALLSEILDLLISSDPKNLSRLQGDCGTESGIAAHAKEVMGSLLEKYNIKCQLRDSDSETAIFLFSCGIIPTEELEDLVQKLKK